MIITREQARLLGSEAYFIISLLNLAHFKSVLTGLSDPYCLLGILNDVHRERHTVKHKHLELWKKEGLIRSVVRTNVIPETLEPEWNEDFHL